MIKVKVKQSPQEADTQRNIKGLRGMKETNVTEVEGGGDTLGAMIEFPQPLFSDTPAPYSPLQIPDLTIELITYR